MPKKVYILGGYQTDFARNWKKERTHPAKIFEEVVSGALQETQMEPNEVQVAHVGNFASELYCKQGHLGAFFLEADAQFSGLPTSRHEAACASGSIAALAATAEIEAERYQVACVVGIEQMKTVSPAIGGDFLGTAAWYEEEAEGIELAFPKLFGRLGDVYDERYGLKYEHLAAISTINHHHAKKNPWAQTRNRYLEKNLNCAETDDNPVIGGKIRLSDCSQITDGAVAILLASEGFAKKYAHQRNLDLRHIPYIKGWGHHTAPLKFEDKLQEAQGQPYVFPHIRRTIEDAFHRAGIADVQGVDGIETHDCFTTSEYMAIDHFGITAPGESWKAIEEGAIELGGHRPINPSGGLIGAGHPVGATGVRMLLDSFRQVTQTAGDYQVEGAQNFATLNIGGSATTSVSFVVGTKTAA